MVSNGIVAQSEWMKKKCPFCFQKLGWEERLKRKAKHDCICKKCGKVIKEQFVVW